jgi:serine O-acetyltransferase
MIGAGAKVLGPFTVGDNVRIGAGSVVLKAVPPYTTVVGVPAKETSKSDRFVNPSNNLDQNVSDPVQNECQDLLCMIKKLEERVAELEAKK